MLDEDFATKTLFLNVGAYVALILRLTLMCKFKWEDTSAEPIKKICFSSSWHDSGGMVVFGNHHHKNSSMFILQPNILSLHKLED